MRRLGEVALACRERLIDYEEVFVKVEIGGRAGAWGPVGVRIVR